jgi:hypothetical protein
MDELPPLVTRDQLFDLLQQQNLPLGRSTLDKLCMAANGGGPPVAAYWAGRGRNKLRPLYEPRAAIAWIKDHFLKLPPAHAA